MSEEKKQEGMELVDDKIEGASGGMELCEEKNPEGMEFCDDKVEGTSGSIDSPRFRLHPPDDHHHRTGRVWLSDLEKERERGGTS